MTNRRRIFTIALCILLICTDSVGYAAVYYGRLYIPDVGIDVGLYKSSDRQGVVDRDDSACIFRMRYGRRTCLIADHYTQSFGPLLDVMVGTTGYIVTKDGETIPIICVEVMDGHNTGHGITDKQKISVIGKHDYLMYTCMGYWRNVRSCQWNKVIERGE